MHTGLNVRSLYFLIVGHFLEQETYKRLKPMVESGQLPRDFSQDRILDITWMSLGFSSARLRWWLHLLRGVLVRSIRSHLENNPRKLC